ncbi:MAG: hypothetical protein ACE5JQ_16090, partial [Candidatus Methylomirabilales bacterium]
MKIWDVSVGVVPGLPVWPGDPPVELERFMSMAAGAAANASRLSFSVQLFSDPEPWTHRVLLGAGVVVVEGLDLSAVAPGWYDLVCLPIRLVA